MPLGQFASDFEASPAAQLVATRGERKRAEKAAKAAQRAARQDAAKGKAPSLVPKAVNVAVQLVGMLRPVGLGNLQGYCSYAMGPHSLLFGYADDRDPNGGGMDGDEIPLFRLQPKFTVDVDLRWSLLPAIINNDRSSCRRCPRNPPLLLLGKGE